MQAQLKRDQRDNGDSEEPVELDVQNEFDSQGSDELFEDVVDKKPGQDTYKEEESEDDEDQDVFDDMFNRATNFAVEEDETSVSKKRK